FAVTKVVLLMWLATIIVLVFFFSARRAALVPSGTQNLAEAVVDFIRNDIILQTIGSEGLYWAPFLLTLFTFIFVCNIFEVIPIIQMPVTARIALPMFMALIVYGLYHVVGVRSQGVVGYLRSSLIQPGVPKAVLPLVMFNELVQFLFAKP